MNCIFTNISWRNEDDSNVFNGNKIETIEIDFERNVLSITFANNKYSSPFRHFHYGGGINHFEVTVMHPYTIGKFITLVVFEHGGKIGVIPAHPNQPDYFVNLCNIYCK